MATNIEVTSIDKGVPIPESKSGSRTKRYPVDELEVGESFEFPLANRGSVQSIASHIKKDNPGREYTVRKIDDVTARIWRTK